MKIINKTVTISEREKNERIQNIFEILLEIHEKYNESQEEEVIINR